MAEPRDLIQDIERRAPLPGGSEERFYGYGVMGLPFASGHILGLRRFPASWVGPGYTSVWHRAPDGRWTFRQDVPAEQACPRYFGSAIAEAATLPIDIVWTGPRAFRVSIDGGSELDWEVSLATTPVTSVMNGMSGLMPGALWHNRAVLGLMGRIASLALRAGRLGLAGRAPNRQSFVANPLRMWLIPSSHATVRGEDLGALGPVPEQARLGDFWIPQRGIFVIGRAFFEPLDTRRHLSVTSASPGA
jgi:hypothetical protein